LADQKSDQNPAIDVVTLLERCGQGKLLAELYDALVTVGQEVLATDGNPGGVTVTFKLTQFRDQPLIVMDGAVKPQLPTGKTHSVGFYPADGALFRDDPRQIPMQLREVDPVESLLKSIDDERPSLKEVD